MSTYIRAVVAAKAIADKYGIPLGDLVDTFSDIPAADVVPVVRCKDCRHCETDYIHEGEYTCFYTGAMGLTLDDFCSKAEGKDEHDKSNNDN